MRKGQYSLIAFIVAGMILLSMTGIVVDIFNQKSDEVMKAQALLEIGDKVRIIKSIQNQERQVGIDFTSIHLGILGGFPAGVSKCGSSINDTGEWLIKSTPYWYSDASTAVFYNYTGRIYNNKSWFTNPYIVFKFDDVRAGLYDIKPVPNNYVLDGDFFNTSPVFLETGSHTFLFATNDLCSHTLNELCSGNSLSLPESLTLERLIPSSDYESCIPDTEFIKVMYGNFLNKYFKFMTELALDQISNVVESSYSTVSIVLKNFNLTEYEAVVEELGTNTIFITFYPLNIPLLQLSYTGLSNTTYDGSNIVFDAFVSDFTRFLDIGNQIINDELLNSLINELIEKHSFIDILASYEVNGSVFSPYEDYYNDFMTYEEAALNKDSYWNVGVDATNFLSFGAYFSGPIKPYCLYYLKEACQFLSDEVPKGYKSGIYNKTSIDLFIDFTQDYLKRFDPELETYKGWTYLDKGVNPTLLACWQCHDVGEFSNPCINLTSEYCLDCFKGLTGKDYLDIDDKTYDQASLAKLSSTGGTECYDLVQNQLKPLLNEYVIYRFATIQEKLSRLYPETGWRLDAQRLNVTRIGFSGVDKGPSFNSSCSDCENTKISTSSSCKFLNSDLGITKAVIMTKNYNPNSINYDPILRYGYNKTEISIGRPDHIDSDDSSNGFDLIISFKNYGNTFENAYLTVLVDGYANINPAVLYNNKRLPDSSYLVSETPVTSSFFDYSLSSGDYELIDGSAANFIAGESLRNFVKADLWDVDFFNGGDDEDGLLDFRINYVNSLSYVSGNNEYTVKIKDFFMPANLVWSINDASLGGGLNTKSHYAHVCIHSGYNDDFNLSNNCVTFSFGVCADGDLSSACCNDPKGEFSGEWIYFDGFGACCGDDNTNKKYPEYDVEREFCDPDLLLNLNFDDNKSDYLYNKGVLKDFESGESVVRIYESSLRYSDAFEGSGLTLWFYGKGNVTAKVFSNQGEGTYCWRSPLSEGDCDPLCTGYSGYELYQDGTSYFCSVYHGCEYMSSLKLYNSGTYCALQGQYVPLQNLSSFYALPNYYYDCGEYNTMCLRAPTVSWSKSLGFGFYDVCKTPACVPKISQKIPCEYCSLDGYVDYNYMSSSGTYPYCERVSRVSCAYGNCNLITECYTVQRLNCKQGGYCCNEITSESECNSKTYYGNVLPYYGNTTCAWNEVTGKCSAKEWFTYPDVNVENYIETLPYCCNDFQTSEECNVFSQSCSWVDDYCVPKQIYSSYCRGYYNYCGYFTDCQAGTSSIVSSAVVNGGGVWVSNDYASTWSLKGSIQEWTDIALSADGRYQTAVVNGGGIWVSRNFGNSWSLSTNQPPVSEWISVSMSSDGLYQTVVSGNGGKIWVSRDYGKTWASPTII